MEQECLHPFEALIMWGKPLERMRDEPSMMKCRGKLQSLHRKSFKITITPYVDRHGDGKMENEKIKYIYI